MLPKNVVAVLLSRDIIYDIINNIMTCYDGTKVTLLYHYSSGNVFSLIFFQ